MTLACVRLKYEVRQAAKLCQMMADRDMKDYLESSTQRFCERMYNLIYFIQGIKEDDPKSGDGLQLIRAVRGLFNMSIVIGARGAALSIRCLKRRRFV